MYFGKLQHTFKPKPPKNGKKPLVNYEDDFLGIAWDHPKRGKHKGTVKDFTYFTCREDQSGGLIPPGKADFGIDLYTGILKKYFKNEYKSIEDIQKKNKNEEVNEQDKKKQPPLSEFDDNAYFETVQKIKKKVEFVGFNKIWKQINNL